MNYKNYKKFVGVGVSGMMMLSIMSPAFALAEGTTDVQSMDMGKKEVKGNFCDNLSMLETRLTKTEDQNAKINSRKDEALSRIKDNWTNNDSKLDDRRAQADAKRASKMAKMGNKVNVNAVVLNTFQTTVDALIKTRKDAVDAAVKAFRDGATVSMNDRKTALLAITTAHKTAITDALAKAKTDCAGGVDAKTVKTNFDLAKKTADQKMKTDRTTLNATKSNDTQKALMETRKQAIKTAQDAFKTGLEQAKATLKQSMQNQPTEIKGDTDHDNEKEPTGTHDGN
ncbi:MAG: hypothetical protein V4439_02375 [Patescibacteria group bacterium]